MYNFGCPMKYLQYIIGGKDRGFPELVDSEWYGDVCRYGREEVINGRIRCQPLRGARRAADHHGFLKD